MTHLAIGRICDRCEGKGLLDHNQAPPLPVAHGNGSFHVLPCHACRGSGVILTQEEADLALSIARAIRAAGVRL